MLHSMTGFGKGQATQAGESIAVEVKTLNHKFCDVKVRLPRELSVLEVMVQQLVKRNIARGAIEVSVRRSFTAPTPLVPQIDVKLALEYQRAWAELAQALGLSNDIRVSDIVRFQHVVCMEEPQIHLDDASAALEAALTMAIDALTSMRLKEGESLKADIAERLRSVSSMVAELTKLAPIAVERHRARLSERIAECVAVYPERLAQEVAFFSERTDIAEETLRLQSHLEQFQLLLAAQHPVGRTMDFLVQEMHREINTCGSKSQHAEISMLVVGLKAELERVREQVQNVE